MENPQLNQNWEDQSILSDQVQVIIDSLNEEEEGVETEPMDCFDPLEADNGASFALRYAGIENLETLLMEEQLRLLLRRFAPQNLLDLQTLGCSVAEFCYSGKLQQLACLIPVKAAINPPGLSDALIILIESTIGEEGLILLKPVPYVKRPPLFPLTEAEQESVSHADPFLMIKRVVESIESVAFQHKQNQLWKELVAQLSISRQAFEKLMQLICYQPHGLDTLATDIGWTLKQSVLFKQVVDAYFPPQIVIYTGMNFLFFSAGQLEPFPQVRSMLVDAK